MNPFEMTVAIIAMVLAYKIMSQVIGAISQKRAGKTHTGQERKVKEEVVYREDPGELQVRTEELTRRLATLEEILVSERELSHENQ